MFGTNLFGIGMPELIFIAVIALIVLGPQRLPGVMREVAKFIAQIRSLTNELTSQFSEEIAMIEELDPRKLIDEATKPVNDAVKALDPKTPAKSTSKSTNTNTKSTSQTSPTSSNDIASSTATEETKEEALSDVEPNELGAGESNGTNSQLTDDGADLVEEVVEVDDGKPKPQTQTDPSNAGSNEPFGNRTPNLNLIKPPKPKTEADAANEEPADENLVEENSMIPPDMRSTVVPKSAPNDGAPEGNFAVKESVSSNGHKPTTEAAANETTSKSTNAEDESSGSE